jgi:hypothetical protein
MMHIHAFSDWILRFDHLDFALILFCLSFSLLVSLVFCVSIFFILLPIFGNLRIQLNKSY